MAKKAEFDVLNEKLDRVIDAMVTHEDLRQLEERLELKIDKRFNQVMTAIDALTKAVTDLRLEYMVINTQLNRHEEWIRLIAKKAGVKLL